MRRKVAIVDDDAASLLALAALVEALGYEPRCFAEPAAFLASDAPQYSAVLIADVRLPQFSGLVLHQRLRAAGIPLPTVLVTAFPDKATSRSAMDAGLLGYLAKPVEPDELLRCLRRAMGQADRDQS